MGLIFTVIVNYIREIGPLKKFNYSITAGIVRGPHICTPYLWSLLTEDVPDIFVSCMKALHDIFLCYI